METAFSRTLRILNADGHRGIALGIVAVAVLLTAWTGWCVASHVTLREVTSRARLEVDHTVYPIQAPTDGRIIGTWLSAGRQVQTGDVLVELDNSAEQLQVREEQTRLATLTPQVEALRRQIASELAARRAPQEVSKIAAQEVTPERDQRGRAAAQQPHFAAGREQSAVRHIEQEQNTRESDRESRVSALEAEVVSLEGGIATTRAAIARLEHEIERRVVRAPASGTLGETAALRVGVVVHEGDRLAALVPNGRLIVVAQFPSAAALGRIEPGQTAVLRLDGFPWMQYGPVTARVARVASEVRDGSVRVEMTVDPSRNPRLPLLHGLPGTVEVQVERVTPASLILRTAGRMMSSSRSGYRQR